MDLSYVASMLKTRAAGVLLHVSSLPSRYGIGDVGAGAREFVDWLAACRIGMWQILPLVPNGMGNSPYCSWTAFGGNPLLIDPDGLVFDGLISHHEITVPANFSTDHVDFCAVSLFKERLIRLAATRFLANSQHHLRRSYETFCHLNSHWLDDAVLFDLLHKQQKGKAWWDWDAPLRDRSKPALEQAKKLLAAEIDIGKVVQFLFEHQWQFLKSYAHERGVAIVGDVPIYVGGDAADVWGNQEIFQLDAARKPLVVAGVPPDAFSDLGQFWGNPLYNWKKLAEDRYSWWVRRCQRALSLTDFVRIDHFRGFSGYWEIPANAPDARTGRWVQGPGHDFIHALRDAFKGLPFIAEDLGLIDAAVENLRDANGLPGMLILQFAFYGGAEAPYLPHNHDKNRAVYTGTHDNETTLGWWRGLPEDVRAHVRDYIDGGPVDDHEMVWRLIRQTFSSCANIAILPMQDILCLGNEARMNSPGTNNERNWGWRMRGGLLGMHLTERVRHLVELYQRTSNFKF